MTGCCEQTLRLKFRAVPCTEGGGNAGPVPDTEILIHLGNLRAQFVGVALTQTTYDEEVVDAPACLAATAERMVSMLSFLASPIKPQVLMTTVRASVRPLSKRTSYPCGGQLRHQMFAVDGILRTAESYDVYLLHLFFGIILSL